MFYNGYPEWTANSDWKLLLNLPCIHFDITDTASKTTDLVKSLTNCINITDTASTLPMFMLSFIFV
jgi:hypothetical protein